MFLKKKCFVVVFGFTLCDGHIINPSDLTKKLNEQREENLLYENTLDFKNLHPPQDAPLTKKTPKEQFKEEKDTTNLPCFHINQIILNKDINTDSIFVIIYF